MRARRTCPTIWGVGMKPNHSRPSGRNGRGAALHDELLVDPLERAQQPIEGIVLRPEGDEDHVRSKTVPR